MWSGAGHSAANVLIDFARLAERSPETKIVWVVRGTNLIRVYGGGLADQLPARGELGAHVKDLVDSGRVTLVLGFSTTAVRRYGEQVILEGETADGPRTLQPVDRVIVATGQRPDLSLTRELRLDLDPWIESAKALGPMIDPNLHSCGSVPPHGHRELSHPEPGFYTVGVKSYGRAPTFLMATGYEQVRSVAAAIAGDMAAADDVRLVLPETGVCSTQINLGEPKSSGCCGGPAPKEVDACCVADAVAKAEKKSRLRLRGCCLRSGRTRAAVARRRDLRPGLRTNLRLGIVVLSPGRAGEAHRGGHGLAAAVDRRRPDHRVAHGGPDLGSRWSRNPGTRRPAGHDGGHHHARWRARGARP